VNGAALADALKSAFRVWLITTIGLFLPGMLGWINEVTKWAAEKGAPPFPDPSNLMYLFIAAITAAFPAAVAGIVRLLESGTGRSLVGPRASQQPVPLTKQGEAGLSQVGYAVILVLAAVVVVFLILRG
jgi:hypothetical protein